MDEREQLISINKGKNKELDHEWAKPHRNWCGTRLP